MARHPTTPLVTEEPEMGHYRNRTRVTQIFYPAGEKIIVDAECTVELPVKYGSKFTLFLERLDTPVGE